MKRGDLDDLLIVVGVMARQLWVLLMVVACIELPPGYADWWEVW